MFTVVSANFWPYSVTAAANVQAYNTPTQGYSLHTLNNTHAASNEYKHTIIHIQSTEWQHMDGQLLLVHDHFSASGDDFLQTCNIRLDPPPPLDLPHYKQALPRVESSQSITSDANIVSGLKSVIGNCLMCLIHPCPSLFLRLNPLLSLSATHTHTSIHSGIKACRCCGIKQQLRLAYKLQAVLLSLLVQHSLHFSSLEHWFPKQRDPLLLFLPSLSSCHSSLLSCVPCKSKRAPFFFLSFFHHLLSPFCVFLFSYLSTFLSLFLSLPWPWMWESVSWKAKGLSLSLSLSGRWKTSSDVEAPLLSETAGWGEGRQR